MRHLLCAAAACSQLLIAEAATAQAPRSDPAPSEIVVTGDRDVERQARDFVAALSPAGPRSQIARFESAVCPAAVGMTAAERSTVERRLRSVARAAGIRVGKPGCSPNAVLMLADDKSAFLDALLRYRPEIFGDFSPARVRRLARTPGPTTAWQLESKLTARGILLDSQNGIPGHRTTEPDSRITAATRPVFLGAALIVEKDAIEGLTVVQIADYAAMRLFARTDPAKLAATTAPSITRILDAPMGSPVPVTLTQWDLGFLRGLYASEKNLYAPSQRTDMRKGILKALERPHGDALPSPTAPPPPTPSR